MENITLSDIGTWVAVISGIIFGYKKLKNEFLNDTNNKMQEQSKKIEEQSKQLEEVKKDCKMQMKIMYCLLEHAVTGNHTNDMKKLLQEVKDYIID